MKIGFKYDSTRFFFTLFVLLAFYFFFLPTLLPPPSVSVIVPPSTPAGEDLPVQVAVQAWHPNFITRRIRFAINNVGSTALVARDPLLPINLLNRVPVDDWAVGMRGRISFPRKETFELTVPLSELSRQHQIVPGLLRGSIDVEIDYTRVDMKADFPPLLVLRQAAFETEVTR